MSPSHQIRVKQNNCTHQWAIQSNYHHCFTCIYCGLTKHNPQCPDFICDHKPEPPDQTYPDQLKEED